MAAFAGEGERGCGEVGEVGELDVDSGGEVWGTDGEVEGIGGVLAVRAMPGPVDEAVLAALGAEDGVAVEGLLEGVGEAGGELEPVGDEERVWG